MTKKRMKIKRKTLHCILAVMSVLLIVMSFSVEGERNNMRVVYPKEYSDYVEEYAQEYRVDEHLVYSIILQESRFNPKAVSSANARGLMQITKDTFDWLKMRMNDLETTYEDLFDPETNIKYGVYFLHLLRKEFSVTSTQLAAYNAGMTITNKWLKNEEYSVDGKTLTEIPYPETKNYVKIVLENHRIYEKLYWED